MRLKDGQTTGSNAYMLNDVKLMLEDGFYFSYAYDVSCSRQRRLKWIASGSKDPYELYASDWRFFWNKNIC